MTLAERQNSIVAQFKNLSNWEDRYKKIIELGKALPEMSDDQKTEEAKVKGCQSQVWLHAKLSADGKLELAGDSDALIVRGLVAILLNIYNGSGPEEILMTPPSFLQEMGFQENLSPSRANGLFSMVKQIRNFAIAFSVLLQSQKK